MKKEQMSWSLLDKKTGELMLNEDGSTVNIKIKKDEKIVSIITDEDIKNQKRQKEGLEKKINKERRKEENEILNKELGGFIMTISVKNQLLFDKIEGLQDSDIPKLLYLGTYLDYKDRSENLLVNILNGSKIEYIKSSTIYELLGISRSACSTWLKRMVEIDMISITKEKYVRLNSKYFLKGFIDEKKLQKGNYARLFIKTVRELYEENSFRKHKQLSYIFKLIPLAHVETNIICKDICVDKEDIEFYSAKEVLNLLNRKTIENDNEKRLLKELHSFRVNVNGQDVRPIRVSNLDILNTGRKNIEYIVLNPFISFKSDYETLKFLQSLYRFEL